MNKKKSNLNKRGQSFKTSKNFYESLSYAFTGIVYCFKYSRNFRIHIICSFIAIFLGRLLKLNGIESIIILATIFSVLILEILNTSIESLVDLVVGKKYSKLAKICKDCSAASVLIASINSMFIAAYVFFPKIKIILLT